MPFFDLSELYTITPRDFDAPYDDRVSTEARGDARSQYIAQQNAKAREDYERELITIDRYNEIVRGLAAEAAALGAKTDEYHAKAEGQLKGAKKGTDEAFKATEAERKRLIGYLDELKGYYGDLIPETVAAARRGVLDERADFAGAMDRAESAVGTEFAGAREALTREGMRYGINPHSGRFVGAQRTGMLAEAGARASARETARLQERDRVERAKAFNYGARANLAGQGLNLISGAQDRISRMAIAASEAKLRGADFDMGMADFYEGRANAYSDAATDTSRFMTAFAEGNRPGGWSDGDYYKPSGMFEERYGG